MLFFPRKKSVIGSQLWNIWKLLLWTKYPNLSNLMTCLFVGWLFFLSVWITVQGTVSKWARKMAWLQQIAIFYLQRGMNVCFMLSFPIPHGGPTSIDGIKIISSKYALRPITLGILSSGSLQLTLSITILSPSWILDKPLYPYKWMTSERANMLELFLVHVNFFMRSKVDKILII